MGTQREEDTAEFPGNLFVKKEVTCAVKEEDSNVKVLEKNGKLVEPRGIGRVRLLGTDLSVEKRIVDILTESITERDPLSLRTYVAFGGLHAGPQKAPLCLPVMTEAVLEPSAAYVFHEEVPSGSAMESVFHMLGLSKSEWIIAGGQERSVWEILFSDFSTRLVETAAVEASAIGVADMERQGHQRVVQFCRLGEVNILRPFSDIHMQLACVARRELEAKEIQCKIESEQLTAVRLTYRLMRYWQFRPRTERQGPSWTLTVSHVQQAVSLPDNATLLRMLDNCISVPKGDAHNMNASLTGWLKQQGMRSTETPFWAPPIVQIRLVMTSVQLVAQLERLNSGLPHGLDRLAAELLLQARALAAWLERGWGVDKEDSSHCLGGVHSRPYFYPSYFGDIAAEARRHYNVKRITDARRSDIEALRRLNNEVKRCLIEKYVTQGATVLDLACGHGQDLNKYAERHIACYVGIDISSEEIREAIRRAQVMERPRRGPASSGRASSGLRLACPWRFLVGNLLEESGFNALQKTEGGGGLQTFDVVSIQLAIHYCLASEEAANRFLQRVSACLPVGGIFIGSTGCCNVIADRLARVITETASPCTMNSLTFGNETYRVTFGGEGTTPVRDFLTQEAVTAGSPARVLRNIFNRKWGISYSFWLSEHIDAREYLVPWSAFCKVAERYGLHAVESSGFERFIACEEQSNQRLRSWIQETLPRIKKNDAELEVFSFYKVFAFTKGSTSLPVQPSKEPATAITAQATASTPYGNAEFFAPQDDICAPEKTMVKDSHASACGLSFGNATSLENRPVPNPPTTGEATSFSQQRVTAGAPGRLRSEGGKRSRPFFLSREAMKALRQQKEGNLGVDKKDGQYIESQPFVPWLPSVGEALSDTSSNSDTAEASAPPKKRNMSQSRKQKDSDMVARTVEAVAETSDEKILSNPEKPHTLSLSSPPLKMENNNNNTFFLPAPASNATGSLPTSLSSSFCSIPQTSPEQILSTPAPPQEKHVSLHADPNLLPCAKAACDEGADSDGESSVDSSSSTSSTSSTSSSSSSSSSTSSSSSSSSSVSLSSSSSSSPTSS